MTMCPHGDPTCPCPDGDACHYEGRRRMPCPVNPPGRRFRAHCHVEACGWIGSDPGRVCGLARLTPAPDTATMERLGCGALRSIAANVSERGSA